jgi:hypothetical protein
MFDDTQAPTIGGAVMTNGSLRFYSARLVEARVWGLGCTVADPVAGAWEPLGVARGVRVDEEARLLAAVAEGAEGVVAVAAAAAVPVALPAAAARARPA